MKVVALITARLGSTRLKRKHLLPVSGRPVLQYLIDAIHREFQAELAAGTFATAIATSEQPENREFGQVLSGCDVFYGSDGNIPLRHHQAALHFGADAILSVDGDDILCSPRAMRAVHGALEAGAAYVGTTGLPLGMNATGYTTELLGRVVAGIDAQSLLETGWGRAFDAFGKLQVDLSCPAPDRLRFTLDYDEDYAFFTALLEKPEIASGRADDRRIVEIVLAEGLDRLTQPVVDRYWENFRTGMEKEKGDGKA